VKAPIDGITGVRQVDAGNIIRQTDANGFVVITAVDPAAVFFTVPQDRLTSVVQALARGEVPVDVYSRDGATKLATGKLAVLDNQINQATATLRLKAAVDNPRHLLWPNAFVKVQMLVDLRKDAVVVPTVAIQHGPQGTYVYAIGADTTAQMKPVTVGLTIGETTVIDKGVDGGEQVIIEGQNQVRPGGKVAPTSQAGDAAGPARGQGKPGPQGQPDHKRGKRGSAEGAAGDPAGAASPGGSAAGGGTRRPPSNDAAPGADAVRPADGQSRPRGPATGPTASTQTPAAP
jgi:multidrug efflux system membrane fusion protein